MTTITEEEREKRIMEEFEREQKAKAEEIRRMKAKKKNWFADITFMPSGGGGGGCGG